MLFLFLSMAILIGWTRFGIPLFFPNAVPKPKPPAAAPKDADAKPQNERADKKEPQVAEIAAAKDGKPGGEVAEAPAKDPAAAPDAAEPTPADQANPRTTVLLGSVDPESGYFAQAEINSRGAAVRSISLNDPRYSEIKDRKKPLKIVGDVDSGLDTLATSVAAVNKQLETPVEKQLEAVAIVLRAADWAVVETIRDPGSTPDQPVYSAVTLLYRSPDGGLEVRKRYSLEKLKIAAGDPEHIRDTDPAGYQLFMDLSVKNLGSKPQTVAYELQGPVGVPLENVENSYRFRDIKIGFLDESEEKVAADRRRIEAKVMTASEVVDAVAEGAEPEEWKRPFQYIGVDVQYFAALVMPREDQLPEPYIDVAQPLLVGTAPIKKQADISLRLTSRALELAPGAEFTHKYSLFTGPKRQAILAPLRADQVIDYGRFGFVAKPLLWLLKFFHDQVGMPYWLAIITLTVIVRGSLFPLSRKQALSAKKMKELQPKIAELKKKYGNDKEKMGRAQMELFSKHNYNPLAGCLPLFIQMPIFFGLYSALGNAVDLRMARFLYVDNLAGPDALYTFKFSLPFLGTDFNLLPLLTVGLFVVQQRMFMPPPTDEQQELQYKMMNFMMIFMGFMFYRVPAGLCLYFIASSLWGMSERKLLDLTGASKKTAEEPTVPAAPAEPAKRGAIQRFWERLLASAEAANEQRSDGRSDQKHTGNGKGKRKSKSR